MNEKKFYAHSLKDHPPEKWQPLDDHLKGVAERAKEFADSFGSGDWAHLAGLWHDLGKFLPDWQTYLKLQNDFDAHVEGYRGRPNHSTLGAILSLERFKNQPPGRILAYLIAGHHAGLADWSPGDVGGDLQTRLYDTMTNALKMDELNKIKSNPDLQKYLTAGFPKTIPLKCSSQADAQKKAEHLHLWIRMIFSCLVDADFLDTEQFMTPANAAYRGQYRMLKDLSVDFDAFMDKKQKEAKPTFINNARAEILEMCQSKAEMSPGFFSLAVPTGGGKTLSSMAFALKHALKHQKKRVIMAIPYTSIIEQTAQVYKEIFGENVLEHHSNIDPEKESSKSRLASENWDAPIVVTTNVQFFESLFSSKTSACRKLHNIANSVIILDEAQMLPPEYLKPILSVLRGLVENFGVTVVLCTATQPALSGKIGSGQAIFDGLPEAVEIVDQTSILTTTFKRCEVILPDISVSKDWSDLVGELKEYSQVLCVVNTRSDCQQLHRLMPEGTFHLSANMCGEERSEVISEIKKRLKEGEVVRVISTQLIEAGVDIDFPVVYRALAGVDSIAQAAGRCNREGKLNSQGKTGKVMVFLPPKSAPVGLLRKGEDASKGLLSGNKVLNLCPEVYRQYFQNFYKSVNDFDNPRFTQRLVKRSGEAEFQFRSFSQDMRLIDGSVQKGIVVYYKGRDSSSFELIDQLRRRGPERWLVRKLQRFIVNVPISIFDRLVQESHVEDIHGYWVQRSTGLYQSGYGLLSDAKHWSQELFIGI